MTSSSSAIAKGTSASYKNNLVRYQAIAARPLQHGNNRVNDLCCAPNRLNSINHYYHVAYRAVEEDDLYWRRKLGIA